MLIHVIFQSGGTLHPESPAYKTQQAELQPTREGTTGRINITDDRPTNEQSSDIPTEYDESQGIRDQKGYEEVNEVENRVIEARGESKQT